MPEKIILAGNPNVGKSTIFNALTGLHQHTGNWSGKTVGESYGELKHSNNKLLIIDTPGTYSLNADSPDEENARKTICCENCSHIVYICDACCLEKSLYLLLQIMEVRSDIIVCINMIDEAKRKGIIIDTEKLEKELGLKLITTNAAKGNGIKKLIKIISQKGNCIIKNVNAVSDPIILKNKSSEIANKCVSYNDNSKEISFLDKILCNKLFGIPIMLLMLFFLLWLSISAANLPSNILSALFCDLGVLLRSLLYSLDISETLIGAIIDGIYGTTAWVISVMLPPIAIFFPLFTLLEDFGMLPRIAFNMDPLFRCCGCSGKQALSMCMGLGCNAVGVTACRIISSPIEKIICIVTNSFMPCNGRFPTIILLSMLIFNRAGNLAAPAIVVGLIAVGIIFTLISSKLLSIIWGKQNKSLFTLELPPYRKPRIIDTVVRALYDRTAKMLLRAIISSAPAGLLIWLLCNLQICDRSIISYIIYLLDKPASLLGMDGVIITAFILSLPANEILMPIIIMLYTGGAALAELPDALETAEILNAAGWTDTVIICVLIFTVFHWPCATTLMTIKKECKKSRYVLLSAALPCFWGFLICLLINIFK